MNKNVVFAIVLTVTMLCLVVPTVIRADDNIDNTAAEGVPALPLWAQADIGYDGPFFQPPPGGPGDMSSRERQRKQRHLEQFRLLKLLEVLDLNEDQEAPFMTAFRAMRRQTRASGVARMETLRRLERALSDENVADSEIYALATEVMRTDDSLRKIRRTFLQSAKKTLTPIQYGKLIIFQEKFDAELLQAAGFFRRGRRGEGSPGNR